MLQSMGNLRITWIISTIQEITSTITWSDVTVNVSWEKSFKTNLDLFEEIGPIRSKFIQDVMLPLLHTSQKKMKAIIIFISMTKLHAQLFARDLWWNNQSHPSSLGSLWASANYFQERQPYIRFPVHRTPEKIAYPKKKEFAPEGANYFLDYWHRRQINIWRLPSLQVYPLLNMKQLLALGLVDLSMSGYEPLGKKTL